MEAGGQDPVDDFAFDTRHDQRGGRIQCGIKQVTGPGELGGGFGGKQVHGRFRGVGQADAGFLTADMGGKTPGGFLADGPDGIDDGIGEAPLVFHAFREGQGCQQSPAFKPGHFEAPPITRPGKIQVKRCREFRPGFIQAIVALVEYGLALCGREGLPCVPIGDAGVGLPAVLRDQVSREPVDRIGFSKHGQIPLQGERRVFPEQTGHFALRMVSASRTQASASSRLGKPRLYMHPSGLTCLRISS